MVFQNIKKPHSVDTMGETLVIHKYPSLFEWFAEIGMSLADNVWMKWISALLLVITLIILFPVYADDNDIWFHLAYGKQYVSDFTWRIDQTQFSWTPVNLTNWIYGTWLGSSIVYLVYILGGITGLYIVQWLILITVLLLMVQYARLLNDRMDMFRLMSLMLTGIVLKLTQIYIKPQLVSTLFFSITVFIYFYCIQQQRGKKFWIYIYPIIMLLWVNIHGEFMVGLAFMGIAFTGEIIASIIEKKWNKLRGVLIPFGVSILCCCATILINPDGIKYPISILRIWLTDRDPVSQANISVMNMWSSVGFGMQNYNFVNAADSIVFMGILYIVFCILGVIKSNRLNVPILLLNVAFFYLSMKAARATLFYPIVWCYSIYSMISDCELWDFKHKLSPFSMGIFVASAGYSLYLMLITVPYATWLGYRLDDLIPKKEVEFIKKYNLPAPIFNDYLLGGYLMWAAYPEYKVWIDPRSGPYINEVLPDWIRISGNLNDESFKYLTTKYPFKIALIGMWKTDMIFWLLKYPNIKLIYFDKNAAVLIDKDSIPNLPQEALSVEVGTARFVDLDNPTILNNLFQFYIHVGPVYAIDIRNIFDRNVSNWLHGKKETLAFMDSKIREREQLLQQMKQSTETIN